MVSEEKDLTVLHSPFHDGAVNVTELVNTCDAGREGELIFRLVYEAAGYSKPFLRLLNFFGGRRVASGRLF